MSITPKQEVFCQAVASGMTQADAYRHAYDVGADTKPETIYSRASELMADSKVSGRVQELKNELSERALWTREQAATALKDALIDAKANNKPTEVVAVVKELNAMHGYNAPVKTEVTVSGSLAINDLTDDQLISIINNG